MGNHKHDIAQYIYIVLEFNELQFEGWRSLGSGWWVGQEFVFEASEFVE
jgi:hypothetical protein